MSRRRREREREGKRERPRTAAALDEKEEEEEEEEGGGGAFFPYFLRNWGRRDGKGEVPLRLCLLPFNLGTILFAEISQTPSKVVAPTASVLPSLCLSVAVYFSSSLVSPPPLPWQYKLQVGKGGK